MNQNALRITSASIVIAAAAAVSFTDNGAPGARLGDPSVPSASEVFRSDDGRSEGNAEDKTF